LTVPDRPDSGEPTSSTYLFSVIRERMNRHEGPLLDFALGRRSDPPPAWLSGLIQEQADGARRRRGQEEDDRLVEATRSMLEKLYGVRVPAAAILPAPSGRAAMSALVMTALRPGDRVLVTEPSYPAFARLAAQRPAKLDVAWLEPERGFAPDLSEFGGAAEWRLAGLNSPNNPTGAILSPASLAELSGRLDPEGLIFNDAVYGPLTFDRAPVSLLADEYARGDGPDLLELHSLGKLFSTGPLGVALLVGPEGRIDRIRRFSDYAWTQITSLQAAVATRCLETPEHVEQLRDGLRDRLLALRAAVTDLGFEPYETTAGIYLLCRAPGAVDGHEVNGAEEAANRLLDEHGLAVVPFPASPDGYLRFCAAYRPEDLEGLIELGERRPFVSY